jgi:chromosome partitioning protein
MIQVIPVINNKGGVGKTTTCVNLAGGLAERGNKVLLVDLDSQGSASLALGVDHGDLRPSVADALFDTAPLADVIRTTYRDRLDLVTGSLDLANADVQLKRDKRSAWQLKSLIDEVRDDYDVILVDCAPSTSTLTVNALVAADAFIIPLNLSYLALEGVVSLGDVVRRVRQGVGEAAPVLGLVVTMFDSDSDEKKDIMDDLRSHYGGKVFNTYVRRDASLEEAPAHSQDIFAYAPDSTGATDYAALVDEVESRIERYSAIYEQLSNRTTL